MKAVELSDPGEFSAAVAVAAAAAAAANRRFRNEEFDLLPQD